MRIAGVGSGISEGIAEVVGEVVSVKAPSNQRQRMDAGTRIIELNIGCTDQPHDPALALCPLLAASGGVLTTSPESQSGHFSVQPRTAPHG